IALRVGDVLLTKDGSTIGVVHPVRTLPEPTTVNGSIAVITPSERWESLFLGYVLESSWAQALMSRLQDGMGVPHLFQRDIKRLRRPLPPLETQQRIADYLDRETSEIDAAVADLDKYVELLEKRRQVMIAQSVTRGIGLDRARVHPCSVQGGEGMTNVKNSDVYWLGKVASDWEVVPAWRVMTERREKSLPDDVHLTPSQTHGVLTQQEYMDRTGNKVVLNLAGADNMKRVRAGDFIIHLRSFEGGIEASTIDGKVSNAYTVLTPAPDAHFGYYRWFMKSVPLIEGLASSTDQLRDGQSINFSRFSRLSLPLAPLETQRRIADYLERETAEIDAAVADLDRSVDLLKKRRKVMIAQSVTRGISSDRTRVHPRSVQGGEGVTCVKNSDVYWLGKVASDWEIAPAWRVMTERIEK